MDSILSMLSERTGMSADEAFFVNDVTFSSDIPLSKKEFFYLTDLKTSSTCTLHDLTKAYKQLRQKKRFFTIDVKIDKNKVHFSLTSNWIFEDVEIKGIWFGKHVYKNLYLQHPGDVFDISLHEESIEAIKKSLYNKGYFYNSVIDEIIYNTKGKTINIILTIKKRSRTRIKDLQLTISAPDDMAVPDQLKKELLELLREHFISKYFSKKLTDQSIPAIKSLLINHGYTQSTANFSLSKREKSKLLLCVKITLPKQFFFSFEGNNFFSESQLRTEFVDLTKPEWLLDPNIIAEQILHAYYDQGFTSAKIRYKKISPNTYNFHIDEGKRATPAKKTDDPLETKQYAEQRLSILEDYQKRGYWYVDAQPEFTTTSTSVHWNITPGQQVKFGKLVLRGKTKLPFTSILKEMQFKQGDLWDRKKLDYSRQKLKELNIFKYISLHPKKISHNETEKPIIVTLVDDDPFEIKLRGGYFLTSKNFLVRRESTYKFGTTLLIKNPLNMADRISLTTDLSRFEKNFDLDYQIPHLFDRSTIFKSKVYAHEYVHPLQEGETDAAYEAVQQGFLTCLSKEFVPHSFFGINIGNEWMKTSRIRGYINLSPSLINKTIPYFFVEPNVLIDQLDDRLQTKKGSFTFSSLKVMVPLTNRGTIYKIMLDRSIFFPINKLVLALRLPLGHIFREKFEEIMPIERFYLGGAYSIRGYSKDAVPPFEGGSSMVNGNFEIRFPINKPLGGVTFLDIGALSQSGFSGFKGRWHPASGFGLRYHTPIGALRFDIGWKWKKTFHKESSFAWYLTLGQCF